MTIGIALSNFATASTTTNVVDRAVELATEAASVGIDTAWIAQLFSYDAVTLAAVVGREVPEIGVGTSVVPIHPRHPIHLAAAAKTAAAATGGRFQLGVGLGAPAFTQPVYGVDPGPTIPALREHLGALRGLLDGDDAAFQGKIVTSAPPGPTRVAGADARIPLLVAAMGQGALHAAGELADGTLPFLAGPQALREVIVPTITGAAQAAGRPTPRVVAAVPAVVTEDVERARAAAYSAGEFYDRIPSYQRIIRASGHERAGDLFLIGDETTVTGGLDDYLAAGATEVIITQADLLGDEDRARTWSAVGAWAAARTEAARSATV